MKPTMFFSANESMHALVPSCYEQVHSVRVRFFTSGGAMGYRLLSSFSFMNSTTRLYPLAGQNRKGRVCCSHILLQKKDVRDTELTYKAHNILGRRLQCIRICTKITASRGTKPRSHTIATRETRQHSSATVATNCMTRRKIC